MNLDTSGLRKAAILVDCLDRPVADRLLEQMAPAQAQRVRQAMVDLGEVDPAEQRRVIDEFFRGKPLVATNDPTGIDLEEIGQRRGQGPGLRVQNPASRSPSSSPPAASGGTGVQATRSPFPGSALSPPILSPSHSADPPFHLLRDTEADKLARVLVGERAQTIALVLSHLPPGQAGNVLVRLAPRQQAEVVRRFVDLEETEPEILREVERALEARLSDHIQMQRRRVAGLSAVAGILEAADTLHDGARLEILDNLATCDGPLAEKLSPRPLEFEELVQLDSASFAAVLAAADRQLLILALVGAAPELVDRFLDRIPEMEGGWIRRELDMPGPTRLDDVAEARRRIARLARRMATQGRIRWPQASPAFSEVLQPAA